MKGQQARLIGRVPGDRPGRVRLVLLRPMRRTPASRRVAIMLRAIAYCRGSMHLLAVLGRHAASGHADEHGISLAASRAVLTACGQPADDLTPTMADVRARTVLTAAPPSSRAPVLAGAAA